MNPLVKKEHSQDRHRENTQSSYLVSHIAVLPDNLLGPWIPVRFFENQTKNGKMSAGQAKTVKKVCKGNNDNCIAIAERIFDKLQTKKIESKLSLLEMLDMLFLRSNSVRTYVLDNFGK